MFIISCHEKALTVKSTKFDNFIFSYSQLYADYSIKFTNSDTIFLQRRFPQPRAVFYSIIQNKDSLKLDSFLTKIDLKKYDTVYMQNNLQDGDSYKFVMSNDTITKWTFIYGNEGPKQLYDFANWLRDLQERQRFYPIDTSIYFGNLNYIVLPQVPPPPKTKNSR